MQSYLRSTNFFDYQHPAIQAFADDILGDGQYSDIEIAKKLYYAVRDKIAYNPYVFSLNHETFSASYCLLNKESYCIPKAVLLGALARCKGIPSRVGLADVKNHLSSSRLVEYLRSDIFVMHGYVELYLNKAWVKATPAFDANLCNKIAVSPLEFDGENDSIFQEFNHAGHKEMEYLVDHGTFEDLPINFIAKSIQTAYPHLLSEDNLKAFQNQSLVADLENE